MKHSRSRFGLLTLITLLSPMLWSSASAQLNIYEIRKHNLRLMSLNSNARGAGMGYSTIGLVDESSPFYNASAMSLFYFDNLFAISKPAGSRWLGVEDLVLANNCYSVGGSLSQLGFENILPFDISFGVATSSLIRDFGLFPILRGYRLTNYTPTENADVTAFGIGIKRILRLGFGYSLKSTTTSVSTRSHSGVYEYGDGHSSTTEWSYMAQLPIHDLIGDRLQITDGKADFNVNLTIFSTYVKADEGEAIWYPLIEISFYPFPGLERESRGLVAGVKTRKASLLSLSYVVERYDQIYLNRYGIEYGIGGTIFVRDGTLEYGRGIDTDGWGVSLRGPLDLAYRFGLLHRTEGIIGFILKRLDVRVDQAKSGTNEITNWSISF